jgi:hypothetical protein
MRHCTTLRSLLITFVVVASGCSSTWATRESVEQTRGQPIQGESYSVQITECADRTDGVPGHNLSQEATTALIAVVNESGWLRIQEGAPYRLTCDVERFVPGSALKRWTLPGWGATSAHVAVMVWDVAANKVLKTPHRI